jgi:hypothetical protein
MSRQPLQSITVYCSSSRHVAQVYFDAAGELGQAIAREGWQLVYGGNDCGCMGALAHAARAAGGKVVGVTPQVFVDEGLADGKCHELIVTPDMRQRKALLEQRGDAFITLPGGLGTLEEIFEILVGRTLGLHDKPIVLLNINRYFDPLLEMIRLGVEQRFIREKAWGKMHVTSSVKDAIDYLKKSS